MAFFKSALVTLLLSCTVHSLHEEDLKFYKTHPEIAAPIWQINTTQPEKVTPGYWFLCPFDHLVYTDADPKPGWLAPAIFDHTGELVWSGWHVVPGVTLDFRPSNVVGKQRLTMLDFNKAVAYLLDTSFDNLDTIYITKAYDAHEWYFLDDGRTGVRTIANFRELTATELLPSIPDWKPDVKCMFKGSGFEVFDVATFTPKFNWDSFDHIPISEGATGDFSTGDCGSFTDYVHANSVDVDHHGDYYMSARHTDSIYKISKDDGHIIWRLHGLQGRSGPWDMGDLTFSRQHNVRFHGFNGTHEIISILDNARGEDAQPPSHDRSRALILALAPDAQPPTARVVSEIGHPNGAGAYAPRRGNYQLLDNGHKWIGWSEQALHSEHDANGELVMLARFQAEWMGTYRSYKLDFSGQPAYPPKAVSSVEYSPVDNGPLTVVHVSWNGATEVASYRLYKVDSSGKGRERLLDAQRTGFETILVCGGYASHVLVEALDKQGDILGETNVTETKVWERPGSDALVTEQSSTVHLTGSVLLSFAAVCFALIVVLVAALGLCKTIQASGGLSLSYFKHRYSAIKNEQVICEEELSSANPFGRRNGLSTSQNSRRASEDGKDIKEP